MNQSSGKFANSEIFSPAIAVYVVALFWLLFHIAEISKRYEFEPLTWVGLSCLAFVVCHLGLHLWDMAGCIRGNADHVADRVVRLAVQVSRLEKKVDSVGRAVGRADHC